MSSTVTIFSCGTAFSRDDNDAVAFSYGLTRGRKWINDGPGSSRGPKEVEAILKRVEAGKGVPERMFKAHRRNNGMGGKLFGTGTQDNIVLSLQWLWESFHKQPFRTINLAGWSRGAVTSIKLAHGIQEAGIGDRGVAVNIFALDPVPGAANDFDNDGGGFDSTGRIGAVDNLPRIVNQYEAVLMENVQGWFGLKQHLFQSVSPNGGGNGHPRMEHPMPGTHADCTMYQDPHNPVGQIAIHLLHDHLIRNGSDLQRHRMLSQQDLLELYATTRLKFARRDGDHWAKRGAQRVRARLVANPFRSDEFFINSHHNRVFRGAFPAICAQIERGQPLTDGMHGILQASCPRTLLALEASGALAG